MKNYKTYYGEIDNNFTLIESIFLVSTSLPFFFSGGESPNPPPLRAKKNKNWYI